MPLKKFVTLTGPSGFGKSAIQHELAKRIKNLWIITSHTDRVRRDTDRPGDYHYLDAHHRLLQREKNNIAWEKEFRGHWYWALKSDLQQAAGELGYQSMILLPETVPILMEMFPNRVVPFWIMGVSAEELHQRLTAAGETGETIERRVAESMEWVPDHEIPWEFLRNDRPLNETVADAINVLRAHQLELKLR